MVRTVGSVWGEPGVETGVFHTAVWEVILRIREGQQYFA